jgi:hypothetical protein
MPLRIKMSWLFQRHGRSNGHTRIRGGRFFINTTIEASLMLCQS